MWFPKNILITLFIVCLLLAANSPLGPESDTVSTHSKEQVKRFQPAPTCNTNQQALSTPFLIQEASSRKKTPVVSNRPTKESLCIFLATSLLLYVYYTYNNSDTSKHIDHNSGKGSDKKRTIIFEKNSSSIHIKIGSKQPCSDVLEVHSEHDRCCSKDKNESSLYNHVQDPKSSPLFFDGPIISHSSASDIAVNDQVMDDDLSPNSPLLDNKNPQSSLKFKKQKKESRNLSIKKKVQKTEPNSINNHFGVENEGFIIVENVDKIPSFSWNDFCQCKDSWEKFVKNQIKEEQRKEICRKNYLKSIVRLMKDIYEQKPIPRGSYSIDDEESKLFNYLYTYVNIFGQTSNINPIAYKRDPQANLSSHYKKTIHENGQEQYGIDMRLDPEKNCQGLLPNHAQHLLFGRITLSYNGEKKEKTFIKFEEFGIGNYRDMLIHGIFYLKSFSFKPCSNVRREKDRPKNIMKKFKKLYRDSSSRKPKAESRGYFSFLFSTKSDDVDQWPVHAVYSWIQEQKKQGSKKQDLNELEKEIKEMGGDPTIRTGNEIVLKMVEKNKQILFRITQD